LNGERAVIIAGGEIQDYTKIRPLIRDEDFIIAADSGYDHAVKLGLFPDIVIGDFDSIQAKPQHIPLAEFPKEKDCSDTALALEHARQSGFSVFLLLAALGNRLDHSLANLFLLATTLAEGETMEIVDEQMRIRLIDGRGKITAPRGTTVSLIPLSDCYGVETTGLSYPLRRESLRVGETRGLSNIVCDSPASVFLEKGRLFILETTG